MGDVADMLGLKPKEQPSMSEEASRILGDKAKPAGPKGGKKPKGMSREVFGLLGKDNAAPSAQTNKVAGGAAFKTKRVSALRGKWIWAPIHESSGTHNIQTKEAAEEKITPLYHWVKAEMQYSEYPYAKFNIQIDRITYSDEEYEQLFQSDRWSRSETDALMSLCHKFDLRWPVIVDRYSLQPPRTCEDMQERYYSVQAMLRARRTGTTDIMARTSEASTAFDVCQERTRRHQLDLQFHKSKEDEAEEADLMKELKTLDACMKKFKKTNRQSALPSLQKAIENKVTYAPIIEKMTRDREISGRIPMMSDGLGPLPGVPALQSSRLDPTDPPLIKSPEFTTMNVEISKELLSKMQVLLRDFGVPPPEKLVATRAVCDTMDQVKRQAVSLLSLQSSIEKVENEEGFGAANACPSEDMLAKTTSETHLTLEHDRLENDSSSNTSSAGLSDITTTGGIAANAPRTSPWGAVSCFSVVSTADKGMSIPGTLGSSTIGISRIKTEKPDEVHEAEDANPLKVIACTPCMRFSDRVLESKILAYVYVIVSHIHILL
jgi:DNA methyltransferase 1-associated protein 1